MTLPVPVTRGGAQHAAQRELSKAIYHRNNDPLVLRGLRAVGHVLDRLLSHAVSGAPSGWLGALALVVVLGLVIVVIARRVGAPRRSAAVRAVLPGERQMTAADHRRAAQAAAEREDWHTAVVERMRAIAAGLEEHGVVDPRPGRTASELAAEVGRRRPEAAPQLRAASQVFDHVAYGGGSASREDLAVVLAADEVLRSPAGRVVAA